MTPNLSRFDTIYTLGPEGTFSYQAAHAVGGDRIKRIEYTTTIPQIADEVQKSESVIGVMPIENSISGTVAQAQDCLVDAEVVIINELLIDVRYSLLSHVPIAEIAHYFCHSVAFNQNMVFASKQMPNAEVVFAKSNIHAGEMFLDRPTEPVAAIVPYPVARTNPLYRKKIVADDTQDYRENLTRFIVLQKKPADYSPDFTRKKTALYVAFTEDRHSLLFELLCEFHVYKINLCRLESRPHKEIAWSYSFFIDFHNNHRVGTCLSALQKLNIEYKLFGSYDIISNEIS